MMCADELYKNLKEAFENSQMMRYGSPDQYQYRQNILLRAIAEYILRIHEDSFHSTKLLEIERDDDDIA